MVQEQEEIVIDFAEEAEKAQLSILVQANNAVVALQEKLKQKGFLTCEECGEEIPAERRAAYPSARTCVPCQEWLDKRYR